MTRGTRATISPSERAWFDDMVGPMCTDLYRSIRDHLNEGRPIDLELFASDLIGMCRSFPVVGLDPVETLVGAVIRRARKRGTREAYVLLRGLAAVAPPTLDRRARAGVRELARFGERVPPWVAKVGRVRCVEAHAISDVYGDQTSLFVSFDHDGEPEHTFVILIDHNLGGVIKDAFVSDKPLRDVLVAWESPFHGDDQGTVREVLDPAETARRLASALDARDRYLDPPGSETLRGCTALLSARLRALPTVDVPEPLIPSEAERDRLLGDFLTSPEADGLGEAAELAGYLVDFKCDHVDGDPLRWSPTLVNLCLLGWFPDQITLEDDHVDRLPEVIRAWVRFAGRVSGMSADLVEATSTWVGLVEDDFRDAMSDPDRFGMVKTMFHEMRTEGVDPADPAQVDAWIEAFNERPEQDRRALLDHVP